MDKDNQVMNSKSGDFKHITPIQIRFNDIDIMGHVNNSVHQNYYDVARVDYFRNVLKEDIDWDHFTVVLASIHIEFYKPVFLQENVAVRTRIEQIGEKSLTMVQELYNPETGEIKSFNRAVLVGFWRKEGVTGIIPEEWKSDITHFEGKISMKYPVNPN